VNFPAGEGEKRIPVFYNPLLYDLSLLWKKSYILFSMRENVVLIFLPNYPFNAAA
jgi:hypothetical protein